MSSEDINTEETDDLYTPLDRPSNYFRPCSVADKSEEEDNDDEDDNDEDDDDENRLKFKIKKPKLNTLRSNPLKRKYNIWCSSVANDNLTEEMNSCNMNISKSLMRNRDVESYDFMSFRKKDENEEEDKEGQCLKGKRRKFHLKKDVRDRLGNRENFRKAKIEDIVEPRLILNLVATPQSDEEDIVKDIANKLCEEKEDLILKIVKVLGKEKAIEVFTKTQKVEAAGGLMIMNGGRRRTPGGVYFALLKSLPEMTAEMYKEIFSEDRKKYTQQMKRKKAKERKKKIADFMKSKLDKTSTYETKMKDADSSENCVINPPPSPENVKFELKEEENNIDEDEDDDEDVLDIDNLGCFDFELM